MPKSAGKRNKRGSGMPGCGRCVSVPTFTALKPNRSSNNLAVLVKADHGLGTISGRTLLLLLPEVPPLKLVVFATTHCCYAADG